ncbi:hypothetical protein EIP86_002700 [Pleurotus ostreatoroseus]|nr:hypothetical protein EIP86_002700 [Pleurotus ostreatoroseus]
MSAPNYDMGSVWDDQYVPPQLEQEEYPIDSTMYASGLHPTNAPFDRRAGPAPTAPSQNGSFSSFGHGSFQGMQDFTFTPQVNGHQPNGAGYLAPPGAAHSSHHGQARGGFGTANALYVGTSSPQHVDTLGLSPNMPGAFPAYTSPMQGLRSGASGGAPPQQQQPPPQQHQQQQSPPQYDDSENMYGAGASPLFHPHMSFPAEQLGMQGVRQQSQSYFGGGTQQQPDMYNKPLFKRPREEGPGFDADGDMDADEGAAKEVAKPKPAGACARCKGLKVKCEFITDPDTCKRCLNGGHECVIPGRKKRRPPPKREHLLSQIQAQADEIKRLMAQLEEANKRAEAHTPGGDAPSPSPSHSGTTESFSLISRLTSPEVEAADERAQTVRSTAEMQDWIAKARASIEAFGGYISMGGPSATREMLAADDDADAGEGRAEGEGEGEFSYVAEGEEGEEGEGSEEGSVATKVRYGSATPERARLATIPSEAAPFGLMAQLSLHKDKSLRRIKSKSDVGAGGEEEDEDVGLANDDYFRPSSAVERPLISENHQPPHILRAGLVTPTEVEKLFGIYWDYMNLSVSLLDPVLYTAQNTYWRSPFLFTVICGIASRYYTARPELYQQAMRYAQLAAGTALIGGQKSVEVVHAYILLALYPVPSRKWEDDRSWIYLGVAIRSAHPPSPSPSPPHTNPPTHSIATDLNLHHPNTAKPRNEQHAREMLNRTRAWLNCFNLDRSTGSQYGKASIINNADYTANRSDAWWNSSPYNMRGFDIHLAGYNADLRVLAAFRAKIHSDPAHPTGLNKNLDVAALASETDDQLARLWETWIARIREHVDPNDVQANFRTGLLRLAYSYARMNVLSFGFQYNFGKSSIGQDVTLLWRCLRAATDVLRAVLEDIAVPHQNPHPEIFLKHGPEAQSVFVTFASAFLIKLLHPRYDSYISMQQRIEIREKVEQIVELLGSPEVSIDDRHGPKLYSRFLQGLLATPAASLERKHKIKAKSESPMVPRLELHDPGSAPRQSMSQPSSARPSAEPEAPPQGTQSPFYAAQMTSDPNAMPMSDTGMNDFMIQPLPFEELLHSMQSVTDPTQWGDFGAIPGFQWMNQNTNDIAMPYVSVQQTAA